MRVLFVTNMWPDEAQPWRGPFVKQEADALESIGVDVDLLAIAGYESRLPYAKAPPELWSRMRRTSYDVVHAHYGHSAVVARFQRRAPLVTTYWGSDLNGKPTPDGGLYLRSRIEAAVFRQMARVSAATVTQSMQMEQILPPSCRPRNHVLPAGVDLDRFQPTPRDEARELLGWDAREPVVIWLAKPHLPTKNFPLAEAAIDRLRKSIPDVRFRWASQTAPNEIPLWMSAADALLVTSRSEGSPNVIKEAMACELPVVSTPVGDAEERLDGIPGSAVAAPDADALADALAVAVRHGRVPEARNAMAALDKTTHARRLAAVYESVAR